MTRRLVRLDGVLRIPQVTPEMMDRIDLPTLANAPLHVDRLGKTLIVGRWAVVTDRKLADNGIIYNRVSYSLS